MRAAEQGRSLRRGWLFSSALGLIAVQVALARPTSAYELRDDAGFTLSIPSEDAEMCVVYPLAERVPSTCEQLGFDPAAMPVSPESRFAAYVQANDGGWRYFVQVSPGARMPPFESFTEADLEGVERGARRTYEAQTGGRVSVTAGRLELPAGWTIMITGRTEYDDPTLNENLVSFMVQSKPPLIVFFNFLPEDEAAVLQHADHVMRALRVDNRPDATGAVQLGRSIGAVLMGAVVVLVALASPGSRPVSPRAAHRHAAKEPNGATSRSAWHPSSGRRHGWSFRSPVAC